MNERTNEPVDARLSEEELREHPADDPVHPPSERPGGGRSRHERGRQDRDDVQRQGRTTPSQTKGAPSQTKDERLPDDDGT
ncbi:hypothetical protein [Streptomyces sp. TLI_105]|uniref:hypothetical protein n=1 Tax=Streptomyces sp. TLI_105 TaxID=1881019 RepID=UPI000899FDDF|nr:hypothetical protein [Streptomyces sp. TLI_105]SEB95436.1 hypothetical protein SAMN05428939_1179 [Streptomyces sp. TLI_105]